MESGVSVPKNAPKTIKIRRKKPTETTEPTQNTGKKLNTTRRNTNSPTKMSSSTAAFKALTENPLPFLETKTTEEIASLLRKAAAEYYKGSPVITDDIFDIARGFLAKRDPTNPALQEIGAAAPGDKVPLPFWMGSLDKIREDPAALEKWKSRYLGKVVVSDKLD